MNQTSPQLPTDSLRIGFIGAGRMATALGRGFVRAGLVTAVVVMAVVLSWLLDNPVHIKPLAVSKLNTVAQIVLAAAVLADEGFNLGIGDLRVVLVWIVAFSTLASLIAYMRAWLAHMAGYKSDGSGA